ncbi:iron-containing alcohol dehydrogenase [Vibrio nigripulchritudo]|uniref:iron-containing alcohol dehydrogenase n=1 Tax=Vibrio nigripulchritudo TaxID=28173 RepID=UPI002490E2EA|nr:iron-containing alcohol dehydrogenase [Vibrio nigripulchritudo]BDU37725.1 alcohol dehydrogenase [Vibrio nigripulchritudo]BDU43445.1 alcohol dehydrogenase [Vibrio nigripulchritudo]
MFQFMTSAKIVFGEGALASSLSTISQYGYSALLVTGEDISRAQPVIEYLNAQAIRFQQVAISSEPFIAMVEEIASQGRKFQPDMVIGFGGGSVIDTAKALAAIIPNQGDLYDYVEVVGRDVPLKSKPLPFIAIPTTASTGAEVTRNAVLRSGQDQVKVSLRSPDMLADIAIVDPELTYGTDAYTSGRGAMDAFTHLMEAYVSSDPNPLTDMICEEGLRRLSGAIIPACLEDNHEARGDLSFAAMLGGMAITNAKLGAAHGLASALGGKLDAPHSVITAQLAPYVMSENIHAAKQLGREDILERYQKIASILLKQEDAHIEDSVVWVKAMLDKLKLPKLKSFGVCSTSFEQVAEDAMLSVAIKGNPIPLNYDRLIYILAQVCPCATGSVPHPISNLSEHYLKKRRKTHTSVNDDLETEE